MKIGWVLGWAVPETWFAALARGALPEVEHHLVAAGPDALAKLEQAAPFDWVAGYSLGSLLMLRESARAGRLGRTALLAPIFAFPREANLGGRVARAQMRVLARWVRRDARAALADFFVRAGLEVPDFTPASVDELLWGLEQLENDRVEPPLPAGWCAWCGENDALLDAAKLQALSPSVEIVPGGTHHPAGLLRAFAAEVAAVKGGGVA